MAVIYFIIFSYSRPALWLVFTAQHYAVVMCPSVCPSVTHRYCTEMAKRQDHANNVICQGL